MPFSFYLIVKRTFSFGFSGSISQVMESIPSFRDRFGGLLTPDSGPGQAIFLLKDDVLSSLR